MATLVFGGGLMSLKIKYAVRKPTGLWLYQRRVPADLLDQFPGTHIKEALGQCSAADAARKVSALVKRDDRRFAALRAHPSTPEHIRVQVDERIATWLKEPRIPSPDSPPPTDSEHIVEAFDDHLLSEYGDAFYELKQDPHFEDAARFDAAMRYRVSALDYATYERVAGLVSGQKAPKKLSDALNEYLSSKGADAKPKASAAVRLALQAVYMTVGDKALAAYERADARAVRDAMVASGVKSSSVRRRLNDIKAVYNFGRLEFDLQALTNPFEKLKIVGEGDDSIVRQPFTLGELKALSDACQAKDDEPRYIVAMMIETGARLGEIVGLRREDLFLDHPTPFVWIREHKTLGRTLKNDQSVRKIPLIGVSLWAAQAALRSHPWLFPAYANDRDIKANGASATLNKWIKTVIGESRKTCHSFRHAMKDRLREAKVPEDVQLSFLGHGTSTTSRGYGEGYSVDALLKYVKPLAIDS